MSSPSRVFVSNHPLILDRLTELRDRGTPPARFRQLVHDLTLFLVVEVCQDLILKPCPVETPLTPYEGFQIGETICLVPVLRAGLGMAEPLQRLLPEAQIWHLGLYRDPESHRPVTYYNPISGQWQADRCIVLDPMLGTGGSAIEVIQILKNKGVNRIQFLGLIAAPEGVRNLQQAHPEVPIHLAAIDSHLNSHAYIVPGLGDAGDRLFGTR